MLLFTFFCYVFSKYSYNFTKINKDTDTSKLVHLYTKNSYKFYLHKELEVYKPIPVPQQVVNLYNMDDIEIIRNDLTYLIKPLKHFKIMKGSVLQSEGYFESLKLENKNLICFYIDKNLNTKIKVIYTLSEDDKTIEKYFSGEVSSFIYKISGKFMGEKLVCKFIYYMSDDSTEDSNTNYENSVNSLNYIFDRLKDKLLKK